MDPTSARMLGRMGAGGAEKRGPRLMVGGHTMHTWLRNAFQSHRMVCLRRVSGNHPRSASPMRNDGGVDQEHAALLGPLPGGGCRRSWHGQRNVLSLREMHRGVIMRNTNGQQPALIPVDAVKSAKSLPHRVCESGCCCLGPEHPRLWSVHSFTAKRIGLARRRTGPGGQCLDQASSRTRQLSPARRRAQVVDQPASAGQ